MDYEKMTSDILRRRDEILKQRRREAVKLMSAALAVCMLGICGGAGIHFVTQSTEKGGSEGGDNTVLTHKPLGDLSFLDIPEGYTASWSVDKSKLGEEKSISLGESEVELYYNYSVSIHEK